MKLGLLLPVSPVQGEVTGLVCNNFSLLRTSHFKQITHLSGTGVLDCLYISLI